MSRLRSSGLITRFNPWWGCSRVSPACQHCYAETFAHRYGHDIWGKDSDRRFFGDKHWNEPLRWNRKAEADGVRRRVFCASMADVFEARADLDEHRARLWELIAETPWLDWLLLTKRPASVHALAPARWFVEPGNLLCEACGGSASLPLGTTCNEHEPRMTGWPANVWIGSTVEDQQRADERLPLLRSIPARIRFLSCEPLLGPLDLDLTGISWVIVGGESGPGARPMHPDWVRDLRDRCLATACPRCGGDGVIGVERPHSGGDIAEVPVECSCRGEQPGVAFLFKQHGDWRWAETDADNREDSTEVNPDGSTYPLREGYGPWAQPGAVVTNRVGKKRAGRTLDGRTWDEFPA